MFKERNDVIQNYVYFFQTFLSFGFYFSCEILDTFTPSGCKNPPNKIIQESKIPLVELLTTHIHIQTITCDFKVPQVKTAVNHWFKRST